LRRACPQRAAHRGLAPLPSRGGFASRSVARSAGARQRAPARVAAGRPETMLVGLVRECLAAARDR